MGRPRTVPRRFLIGALIVVVAALVTVAVTSGRTSGQMTGIVVAFDGDLTGVRSFDVLSGGEQRRFVPSAEGRFDFPLGHLRDHLRTGEPVVVEYERMDGVWMAVGISDAR